MGIEPTQSAWKAEILPLNYTRLSQHDLFIISDFVLFVNPFFSYFFIFLKNLYYVGFLSLLIFGLSLMKEKLRRDLTEFPEILKLISLRNI